MGTNSMCAISRGRTLMDVVETSPKVKLHLGCGVDYRPGWINVDNSTRVKVDQVVDLSQRPWPFPDNYADEMALIDVMEHLDKTFDNIHEIHRILKPGGLVTIHVPYAKSDGAFQDPQHYSFFTEKTFDYVCDHWRSGWYNGPRFHRISVKLDVASCTWKNRLRNKIPFRMFLRHFLWNMYDEVKFVLRKVA
jgi:SAM-dependent methyltransferase